jgi:4-amino-4-deoxy-L-arabinose transferase-like glycosyltransferase
MDSLQSLDIALFRFVNLDLTNRFCDWVLPFFSSNSFFIPVLIVLAVWLTWKGGVRGRLLVFFLLLTFLIGDPLIVRLLKQFFDRPRPAITLSGIHLLVGKTDKGSMPSGHCANWFAAVVVAFVYYRRSIWFMLPMALIEAFSRIYLGAHYPSDVLVGSLLGMAYATLILWVSDAIWGLIGRRWFPIWWANLPSLLVPAGRSASHAVLAHETVPDAVLASGSGMDLRSKETPRPGTLRPAETSPAVDLEQHWLRLAYVLIGLLLAGHLIYLASGKIDLSEDEAYQWLWSKHLALSYYSKPPLIAYTQFLGTSLWGDTEFGVRFFAPVLGAAASVLLVGFLARERSGFTACLSVLVATATPLLMVGATLMTIDSLSVLFWVAAMVSGWRAAQDDSTRGWLWTGLWMGLGFLSKYTALFQLLCWAVFFVLWRPARAQLRRPGPYLALLVNAVCLVPVWIWNAQHDWITMTHLADRGGLDKRWQPTLRFFGDFIISEAALLNPVFFVGLLWAAIALWRRPKRADLWVYLFSMGAPLFLFYLCFTFRARVQPNWVAPSVLPLFCLLLLYWDEKWTAGWLWVRFWLIVGITLGWIIVVPLHDTQLIAKVTGKPLSWELDPLTRVLGWKETAQAVSQARVELQKEGKPTFIIGGHYGITSLLTFYIPEARTGLADTPLVYCESSEHPENQFYFWPGYAARKGQNAIYVAPVDRFNSQPPAALERQFTSVTDLGVREVLHRGRVFHRIHLFACRDLR